MIKTYRIWLVLLMLASCSTPTSNTFEVPNPTNEESKKIVPEQSSEPSESQPDSESNQLVLDKGSINSSPANQKPIVQDLSGTPIKIKSKDDLITFVAKATDQDGDALKITWNATHGILDRLTGNEVKWRPADFTGNFKPGIAIITLSIDDNKGGIDSASINVFIEEDGSAHIQKELPKEPLASKPQAVEIQINQDQYILEQGKSITVNAQVIFDDKSTQPGVKLKSSDESILKVNSLEGQITRLAPGKAKVFLTTDLNPNLQREITILEPNLEELPTLPTPINTPSPIVESPVTPETTVPSAPSGLSSENISVDRFTLNWNAVPGANSYNIFRNGDLVKENHTQTSYTFEGLTEKTTYQIQVSALNVTGESQKSSAASITTLINGPQFTGKLFFTQNTSDGNNHVLHSLSSGQEPLRLTFDGGQKLYPYAHGQTLFFANPNQIQKLNLSNGQISPVIQFQSSRPHVSKNGTKLVFSGSLDNNTNIYSSNLDGTGIQELTTHAAWDSYPAWSPDGSKIAFLTLRDGQYEIYTMNPDGSNKVKITNGHNIHESNIMWTNDGQNLIYLTKTFQMYMMNSDGSNATPLSDTSVQVREMTLSPDNSHIAFATHDNKLYITPISEFSPEFITNTSHPAMAWSN